MVIKFVASSPGLHLHFRIFDSDYFNTEAALSTINKSCPNSGTSTLECLCSVHGEAGPVGVHSGISGEIRGSACSVLQCLRGHLAAAGVECV
ncbi:hypothetical protein F0562_000152 [Nyssa sinensis]|uniref:Uncharacterized protein n=1 Tax=Nyssa sinensis TaxID=561372 RepID=A0A5J5BZN9_9ASTE|nr:hypothetical protein F0562_000152 [Nyssa sinensis]